MKGHVCKESWSRCEPPSMLYDTVRNPRVSNIQPRPIQPTSNVDTIESTQKRLNKQMLERIRNIGLQLPHESFVAVVQVGKYVFLAIMLPPYLMLYGLPKWLLFNIFPQLLMEGKEAVMTVGKYVSAMMKYVTDVMKGVLDQLLGDALRMTRDQAKNFWRHLETLGRKIADAITKNIAQMQAWQNQFTGAFAKMSGNMAGTVSNGLATMREQVVAMARMVAERVTEHATKGFQFFDKNVLTPAIETFLVPFRFAGKVMGACKESLSAFADGAKNFIREQLGPVVAPIRDGLAWAAEHVRKLVEKVSDPVMAWAKERIEAFRDAARRARENVIDPVAEKISAAGEKAKEWALAGVDMVKNMALVLPLGFMRTARMASKLVPRKSREKMQRRKESFKRWGGRTKSLATGVVSGVKEIVGGAKRACVKTVTWLMKFRLVLLRFAKWMFYQALLIPRRTLGFAKVLGASVATVAGQLFFGIRIIVAVLWAACWFGYYLLRSFRVT